MLTPKTLLVALSFKDLEDVPLVEALFSDTRCPGLQVKRALESFLLLMFRREAESTEAALTAVVSDIRAVLPEASTPIGSSCDEKGAATTLLVGPLELRKDAALRQGLAGRRAFGRLLDLAEGPPTGQARTVAEFVASTVGHGRFDIYGLRAVDTSISADMITCLETIRWGKVGITDLLPNGAVRAERVSHKWGHRSEAVSDEEVRHLQRAEALRTSQ